MKELLYIPNGTYIRIQISAAQFPVSIEQYAIFRKVSIDNVIEKILDGYFIDTFYKRNDLPDTTHLSREQFEIVETDK